MSKYLNMPLLAFAAIALIFHSSLTAAREVRPVEFMAKSYERETNLKFQRDTPYRVIHSAPEGYYVHLYDKHDVVVLLKKDADALNVEYAAGELIFKAPFVYTSERAYIVFTEDSWYPVLEDKANTYQIEYSLGKTKLRFSVDKGEFILSENIFDKEGRRMPRRVEKSVDAICVLNFSTGSSGTGFLLYEGDALYCYTNHHVAMNTGRLRVSLVDGRVVEVGKIEIAEDVDLARIEVLGVHSGFDEIASPVLQEKVLVLGNSLGSGRVTSLKGVVNGVSADEVETTVKFVSGNSGSPILNESGAVIGVAAWIEYFPDHNDITKGSSFEGGRRVGVRLDREIEWVEVDIGRYLSRNRMILQTVNFIEELPYAMSSFFQTDAEVEAVMKELKDPILKQWTRSRLTQFKAAEKKYNTTVEAGVARLGNRYKFTPAYASAEKNFVETVMKESQNFWNSLQIKIKSKISALNRAVPHPDVTYMRNEIKNTIRKLEEAQETVAIMQKLHVDYLQGSR